MIPSGAATLICRNRVFPSRIRQVQYLTLAPVEGIIVDLEYGLLIEDPGLRGPHTKIRERSFVGAVRIAFIGSIDLCLF